MNNIVNYNNPVASNVIKIIENKGLKQRVIAEKANMTAQALCDILNGRRILKVSEVNNLAKSLCVEVNDLFKTE